MTRTVAKAWAETFRHAAELCEAMQAWTKIAPHTRRAPHAEIEAMQMPLRVRKRRMFVDLR
jgi:hypothetical protein